MDASFPTFEQVLGALSQIIGGEPVAADSALAELAVDSLDLLEWAFALEERFGLVLGDELFAVIDFGKPLRELYLDLRASVESHA
jgi:acyl carrier protein